MHILVPGFNARIMIPLIVTTILVFSSRALAWGALGHETVAYIAQNFMTPETEAYCQKVLGNQSSSYLAGIATWADSYRRSKGKQILRRLRMTLV